MAKKKGKGRGWHGNSAGHSVAARKAKKKSWQRGASTKKQATRENVKITKILTQRTARGAKGGKLDISSPKSSKYHPTNSRLRQRRNQNIQVLYGFKIR